METLVIDHLVEKKREGSYYSLPFSVPEGRIPCREHRMADVEDILIKAHASPPFPRLRTNSK